MLLRLTWLVYAIWLMLSFSVHAQSAEMRVIAHPDVTQNSVSQRQLRRIFSLKQRTWEDGSAISLIVLSSDNEQHIAFLRQQLQMFPYQLEREWNKLVYSGQASPPVVAVNNAEMRSLVASTPGAIGYLLTETTPTNVKIIEVESP
ncbi:hypothetical protein QTP81_01455 [Alteromonas sp. ASW11-36]|uniref:PBP domain-containing protein n=1 Tax=Alteromonas arenosi TaxID=3055817 RepID=A0ABT7SSV3_9ALTE|nr:hypothetical protein [Alteromonas sp. ASW11-36]MDM7859270.1 hypothetical protein [Alteromonas sp. ASW11-36]